MKQIGGVGSFQRGLTDIRITGHAKKKDSGWRLSVCSGVDHCDIVDMVDHNFSPCFKCFVNDRLILSGKSLRPWRAQLQRFLVKCFEAWLQNFNPS